MRHCMLALLGTTLAVGPLAAQGTASTASTTPARVLVSRAAYPLPPYDSLTDAQRRELRHYADSAEYDTTRLDAELALERVRYRSGGLEVVAYVYAPRRAGTALLPAIIYNRGSWVAGDLAPAFAPLFRRLARAGFVVVAPQYRGSDGGEGTDELGGADVDDVLAAIPLAAELGTIDTTRLFMYGESRGGMMTYQALRGNGAIRAAATVGAFTDLGAMLEADEEARTMAPRIWPDFAERREEIVARRSVLRWADEVRAPVLILHGGADTQVSPEQALALGRRLQALGASYELHILAGEGHTLRGRSRERDALVVAWFRRHLE